MDSRKVDLTGLSGGTTKKEHDLFTPQEVANMTPVEALENLPKIEKSKKWWEEMRKKK